MKLLLREHLPGCRHQCLHRLRHLHHRLQGQNPRYRYLLRHLNPQWYLRLIQLHHPRLRWLCLWTYLQYPRHHRPPLHRRPGLP